MSDSRIFISKLGDHLYDWIHWQAIELYDYKVRCRDAVSEMGSGDQKRQFEDEFGEVIASLEHANSRFTKTILFSTITTVFFLWVGGIKPGAICAGLLILIPYWVTRFHVKEDSYGKRHFLVLLIERRVAKRNLFADAVVAVVMSAFFIFILWAVFWRRPS